MHILFKIISPVLILALAGCATVKPTVGPDAMTGQAFLLPEGKQISPQQLQQIITNSRLIVAGESHRHPGHHAIQARLMEMLAQGRDPQDVVVGIEWLDQTHEDACNELSSGAISTKQFAQKVRWGDTWGYPLEMFLPVLEQVRQKGYTLVPLNAPAKVVRQIGRRGLASLSPEQRKQIAPDLYLNDPAYKKQIARQLPVHAQMGSSGLDNFFTAQVARDETMAHNMAHAMSPWPDGKKAGIVFTGLGHMSHGRGLPPRIARRLPGEPVLLVVPIEPGSIVQSNLKLGAKPADILIVSTPKPPRPPRLGVILEQLGDGLLVKAVVPGSAADTAGVKKGDILLKMSGKKLNSAKDIHNAVKNAPGAPHTLRLKRGEKILKLRVSLKSS